MDGAAIVLQARDIVKTYGATRALRGVSIELRAGEIHGICGGNGSGKSTLVKILAGVETADGGELDVAGSTMAASTMTPEQARALGLRFIHQNPGLFQDLTIADNLSLGRGYETGMLGRIRSRAVVRRAGDLLRRYHLDVDPRAPIGTLNAASQTVVAIARAMQDLENSGSGVLVLDEPTAALPQQEAELLLGSIRKLAAQGLAIVLITHRLDELLAVCDRVTALRDGHLVGVYPASELDESGLVRLIVGSDVSAVYPNRVPATTHEPVLELDRLEVGALRDVNLRLAPGEIVGVAGLLGSGRTTLLQALFGERRPDAGEIRLDGQVVRPRSPAEAIRLGIGYVPEDRSRMAAFDDHSVADNAMAASWADFSVGTRISTRQVRREALRLVDEFGVKTGSVEQPLSTLSGGNQQKVILARWMRRTPRVLLLDEPTQGVDVGARADIYHLIGRALDAGAAVLVAASDMEELARVCDRVLVLRGETLTDEVRGPRIDPHHLNELIYAESGVARHG